MNYTIDYKYIYKKKSLETKAGWLGIYRSTAKRVNTGIFFGHFPCFSCAVGTLSFPLHPPPPPSLPLNKPQICTKKGVLIYKVVFYMASLWLQSVFNKLVGPGAGGQGVGRPASHLGTNGLLTRGTTLLRQ